MVPAAKGGAHAYFDALVRRSEHVCNWGLRDQAQLDSLVSSGPSTFFTYTPSADTYRDKQDAAKFYVGTPAETGRESGSIPTTQQLRMPIPKIDGSVLIAWDWYWGSEFRDNRGTHDPYKTFHIFIGGHQLMTLMVTHIPSPNAVPGEVGQYHMAGYGSASLGTLPKPVTQRKPWDFNGAGSPYFGFKRANHHKFIENTWTRFWMEFRLAAPEEFTEWNAAYGVTVHPNPNDPQGRWMMVSLWAADENRDPVRLHYKVPSSWDAKWSPHISRFDFEMNTSDGTGFVGPWIGYGRNVVVLRDYALPAVPESDTFLFQRPRR